MAVSDAIVETLIAWGVDAHGPTVTELLLCSGTLLAGRLWYGTKQSESKSP
jgi:hypothetical protein